MYLMNRRNEGLPVSRRTAFEARLRAKELSVEDVGAAVDRSKHISYRWILGKAFPSLPQMAILADLVDTDLNGIGRLFLENEAPVELATPPGAHPTGEVTTNGTSPE